MLCRCLHASIYAQGLAGAMAVGEGMNHGGTHTRVYFIASAEKPVHKLWHPVLCGG
jgi:hypothetical protein